MPKADLDPGSSYQLLGLIDQGRYIDVLLDTWRISKMGFLVLCPDPPPSDPEKGNYFPDYKKDWEWYPAPAMVVPWDGNTASLLFFPDPRSPTVCVKGVCALTEGVQSYGLGGPATAVTPVASLTSVVDAHRFDMIDQGDGTFSLRSLASEALLSIYDLSGKLPGYDPNEDTGAMLALPQGTFIVLSEASANLGAPKVSSRFMIKPNSAVKRCKYPSVRGPVREPLSPPPQITSVDQELPERVPSDRSQDPVYGEMALPFLVIEDNLTRAQQVQYSLYYVLRHTRYYKLSPPQFKRRAGPSQSYSKTVTIGISHDQSTSLTKTLNMTVMADGGFSFGDLSVHLSATIEKSLAIEQTSTTNKMETTEIHKEYNLLDGEAAVIAVYQLVHAFDLFRADDGSFVRRWEVVNDDVFENCWIKPGPAPST